MKEMLLGMPPKKKQEKIKKENGQFWVTELGKKKNLKIAGDFIALHRLIERAVLVAWRQLDVMKL